LEGGIVKKFMNAAESMLTESLTGFAKAHHDIIVLDPEFRFVRRKRAKTDGRVALISGGGSGHEPLHIGFVGGGMLDAACPGNVFTSPTPDQMLAAAEAVDCGGGVLFIVKNYAGDIMNFSLGTEMYTKECGTLITDDDVAIERSEHAAGRRGVAGTLVVEKVVGAAAERGDGLAALTSLGKRVNEMTRSMGVALTSCTVPAVGRPTFELGDDEMEMGVGIHGEAGRRRVPLRSANAIAEELVQAITDDLRAKAGSEALLLVNGFGGTPSSELYLMYDAAERQVAKQGLKVTRSLVGSYVTSLEMAGCSVTVTLIDEQMTALWDAPVHTAALRW
jgi:phosphoenolpyruvate---glycerone phosphotransferase subunit DhaK